MKNEQKELIRTALMFYHMSAGEFLPYDDLIELHSQIDLIIKQIGLIKDSEESGNQSV